jgi:hypothetical protein
MLSRFLRVSFEGKPFALLDGGCHPSNHPSNICPKLVIVLGAGRTMMNHHAVSVFKEYTVWQGKHITGRTALFNTLSHTQDYKGCKNSREEPSALAIGEAVVCIFIQVVPKYLFLFWPQN